MKRHFLQLCQTYKTDKLISGWYISEKLDGQRAFWDGGISRGIPAREVPYANTEKDSRLIEESVATGLWSRMAKVIHAPDEWLDQLPAIPLDGELYIGPQQNQEMASIVRSHSKENWGNIQYLIFDSPPYEEIFADGEIEIRFGNEKYHLYFHGIMDWVKKRGPVETMKPDVPYFSVLKWLQNQKWEGNIRLLNQEQLPYGDEKVRARLEEKMDEILANGGEGLIIRSRTLPWTPSRTSHCLKMKPDQSSEGLIIGYNWGREGKLLGKMGNLVVAWNGVRFELSGFTDKEREMSIADYKTANAFNEGYGNPGKRVSEQWINKTFPIGSMIEFKFRELSRDGIPKEARFFRKRESE